MMKSWKNLKINNNRMRTKFFSYSALFVFITTLLSCEKVIEPKSLPQQDSRLVLNALFYGNSNVVVNVSASKSIVSNKAIKYIDNAICALYDNGVFVENLLNFKGGNYLGKTQIKEEHSYELKVSAPGYTTVNASTQIPAAFSYSSITRYDTINSFITINDFAGTSNLNCSVKLRGTVIDDSRVKNHYLLLPSISGSDADGNTIGFNLKPYISSIGTNNGGYGLDLDDLKPVNGNQIPFDVVINCYQQIDTTDLRSLKLYLFFYSMSDEYYKYRTAISKQQGTGVSLFSEPVLDYSNVANGMGVMAGASQNLVLVYEKRIKK